MAVEAVTFDFWNTLCAEPPGGYLRGRRLEAMGRVLVDAGVDDAGVALSSAYDAVWRTWVTEWEANRQFPGRQAARMVAGEVERAHGTGAAVSAALVDAFMAASDDADLLLIDGVEATLDALGARGVRMGIVCDVGFTASPVLRSHLARRGVLDRFDHWSFSDEVGVYKPARRIFEHALAGLGDPDPARCAHVGDRRRTDVAGAMAVGMRAIRLTAVFDDDDPAAGPSGDAVVRSYDDLLPALGLA